MNAKHIFTRITGLSHSRVSSLNSTSYSRLMYQRNAHRKLALLANVAFYKQDHSTQVHFSRPTVKSSILISCNRQETSYFCTDSSFSEVEYEELAENTLEALSEKFEDIQESLECSPEYDVSLGSGVLTVTISSTWGTYVINKQTPNKQIWLSSPLSGPKRYDYVQGTWIYKHDGQSLQQLLTQEISQAFSENIDFSFLNSIKS